MSDPMQDQNDRATIAELRSNFAWALDTRDWDLFARLFTDEVDTDLTALGLPAGVTPRATLMGAFQHVFRRPAQEMGTQQLYGSVTVELDGDSASVRSYLIGHHHIAGFDGGEDVSLRGAYLDRATRTSDGWRISATRLQVFSMVGNPAIFA